MLHKRMLTPKLSKMISSAKAADKGSPDGNSKLLERRKQFAATGKADSNNLSKIHSMTINTGR